MVLQQKIIKGLKQNYNSDPNFIMTKDIKKTNGSGIIDTNLNF